MQSAAGEGNVVLAVEGMTCGGCARAVESAIGQVPGVLSARVDLAAKRARVEGVNLDPAKLAEAVEDAGFSAQPVQG
jgi:P-type Cu+ transporter